MTLKTEIAEVVQQLRDAAKLQDPYARAAVKLTKLLSEDIRESLVSAEGDDMLRRQGAARFIDKLHKDLTTTPPGIIGATS